MKALVVFLVAFVFSFPSFGGGENFIEVDEVVNDLREAYILKNIDRVVESIDFFMSARLINNKFGLTNDAGLEGLAHDLLNEYKLHVAKVGFPDYSNLKCNIGSLILIRDNVGYVLETCFKIESENSRKLRHKIYVGKTSNGWKVLNGVTDQVLRIDKISKKKG